MREPTSTLSVSAADPAALHQARQQLRKAIAGQLEQWLLALLAEPVSRTYTYDAAAIGRRALLNTALSWLADLDLRHHELAWDRFVSAGSMTDELAALTTLVHASAVHAGDALSRFEARWAGEALVMDQWFAVQATLPSVAALGRVSTLMQHPGYDRTTPNRVRSLVGQLANMNPVAFHAPSGLGYEMFCAEVAVLEHHERMDGSGYPRGLGADAIALETRIITTADIFDAINAERPYHPATPVART